LSIWPDQWAAILTQVNLGMDKLQKSTNGYVKWINRRNETNEDKEKALPIGFVGRMMVQHGEDFEPNSEYGNCLIGTTMSLVTSWFLRKQLTLIVQQPSEEPTSRSQTSRKDMLPTSRRTGWRPWSGLWL